MAKITYKGQGEQEVLTFRNTEFKKGEAVEVTDPVTIGKLQNNPNFTVEVPDKPPEDTTPPEPQFVPAPSTISAQHPVPKPGEPITPPTTVAPLKPVPKVHK